MAALISSLDYNDVFICLEHQHQQNHTQDPEHQHKHEPHPGSGASTPAQPHPGSGASTPSQPHPGISDTECIDHLHRDVKMLKGQEVT